MEYEFTNRPSFAELVVTLSEGETIRAETGALLSHSSGVELTIEPDREGTGLSTTVFSARHPGTVTFAPPFPGDIVHYRLEDETLYTQSCSYLAAESDVEFDAVEDGEGPYFSGEGLFLLALSGHGQTFLSSYGSISVVSLDTGERHVIDTGHVVAFEETVDTTIRRVGEGASELAGDGELICEFEGPGSIWTQARSTDAVLAWILSNLPSAE